MLCFTEIFIRKEDYRKIQGGVETQLLDKADQDNYVNPFYELLKTPEPQKKDINEVFVSPMVSSNEFANVSSNVPDIVSPITSPTISTEENWQRVKESIYESIQQIGSSAIESIEEVDHLPED